MKLLVVTVIIVVVLMDHTAGQYPDCISCDRGSIPLSPLSYNTVRSNVFNGTQPSNGGCTNGAIVNGQVTINCGQGTTLIDCDRGLNTNPDYSDLSNTFAWNNVVSVTFRFDQQISISTINMFFWNSPSNSILVPNVMLYWADQNMRYISIADVAISSPNRTEDGQSVVDIDINNDRLQYLYLRIMMTHYENSQWIFLGEVQFCGNTAPFHITHPSTDNDVQIVSPTATMASVTCSLNVTIPSSVIVIWTHNTRLITDGNRVTTTGRTTTLVIRNPQPSVAGTYQCVFNDVVGSGFEIRRNIRLTIADISTATISTPTTTITAITSIADATTTPPAATAITSAISAAVTATAISASAATNSIATSSTVTTIPVVTDSTSIRGSVSAAMVVPSVTTSGLPTLSSSSENNNSSSSVGVIVAIIVLVVVVFIIITVVVVGIIVVWKRKKSQQHAKPAEGVYYSTTDAKASQRPPSSKPDAVYSEVNDEQDSKEPQYMDVTGGGYSTKQADKVIIQDNPAYSVHQTKDNPANDYLQLIPGKDQVIMQDNPAYSAIATM